MVRALNGNVKPAPKLHSFNHFCQKCLLLINSWLKFLTTALQMTALTWRLTHLHHHLLPRQLLCCHLSLRQLPHHRPSLRSHLFIALQYPLDIHPWLILLCLHLISQSWGINTTFKVVKHPFTQLLSIHALFHVSSFIHFFLLSCLANKNMTIRKCSGQLLTYSHLFACSPSPSTLRQLCGRHFIKHYPLWPSMAVSFPGPKLCGERLKSWDYRWHTTQTTTLTSSSESCSLFHIACWTHLTHLHQTSRKSSNSTSSRINHLHTVNMVEQHPLATYCLVSIWLFHQDKQWCGGLASPLKQEGQERSTSLLSSPVPAPWWSKTSQHPGPSDQWGKVNQLGKSKVQSSTIFSIQTLARLHQQHQNTITASQSMF